MLNKAKQNRFYQMADERSAEIQKLRAAQDKEGLMKLQNELIALLEKEFEGKKIEMPAEMKKDYMTIGGTPFLDNEYTVFGEVVEGLEVIDAIAAVQTMPGDRPKSDLKMKIEVVK